MASTYSRPHRRTAAVFASTLAAAAAFNAFSLVPAQAKGVGDIATYPVGYGNYGIVAGPDGNLWVAARGASEIARVTTAGAVTDFPTPTADR